MQPVCPYGPCRRTRNGAFHSDQDFWKPPPNGPPSYQPESRSGRLPGLDEPVPDPPMAAMQHLAFAFLEVEQPPLGAESYSGLYSLLNFVRAQRIELGVTNWKERPGVCDSNSL